MKDHLDLSDRATTHCDLAEIAAQKLNLPIQTGEIRFGARAEIVYDPNIVAESNQPLGDMGTDKARSPRDEAP